MEVPPLTAPQHQITEVLRIVGQYEALWSGSPTDTPSDSSIDGPLLGNGDMLISIGGPPDAVVFHLGKNDFWRLEHGDGNAAPLPVGTLTLATTDLAGADYGVNQALVDATTRLTLDGGDGVLRMECRVLAQENLLLIGLTAERRDFDVTCRLSVHSGRSSVTTAGDSDGVLWSERAFQARDVDIPTSVVCAMTTIGSDTGGHAVDFGSGSPPQQPNVTVGDGKTAWVAVAMESLFKSVTPRDDAIARCARLQSSDFPALTAEHAEWWAAYWDQAWIEIGDPLIEKAYYLSYYGMGSCSRDPEFPPAIFGWTTTDAPGWNGDYHTNYNHAAPFYALASGNRLEQLAPHDAPVLKFMSRAEKYATDIFGSGSERWGVLYPVGIGPEGIDSTHSHASFSHPNKEQGVLTFGQRSNAAYMLVNMAEHWRRTYDLAYGASIYAYAKEVIAFWEQYLVWESSRYKIVGDSVHEGSGTDVNPVQTLGLLRNALDLVIDLSEELDQDAGKRVAWRHILENLSGYTTQVRDGVEVFRYTEAGTAWWDDNSLGIQHIFPAGAVDHESEPSLVTCSRNTIDVMQRWYDFNGSNSIFPAAVRVGLDPQTILEKLRGYERRMAPNGFQRDNPHGIENLSTVPCTINEMLCMSQVALGYAGPGGPCPPRAESMIRLFPVWPREQNARFTRLRAWGGFLVSSSLRAGAVEFVELISEQARHCTMRNPWIGQSARLYRNGELSAVMSGTTFAFPTARGDVIRLLP